MLIYILLAMVGVFIAGAMYALDRRNIDNLEVRYLATMIGGMLLMFGLMKLGLF